MTKNLIKYFMYIIVGVASYVAGDYVGRNKSPEIKEVVKIQQRVRTRTQIVERPDGSKVTTIVQEKETKSDRKFQSKPSQSKWSVGLGWAPPLGGQNEIYTLSVDRRILANIHVGLYGRTDKEFGVRLRFDF